MYASFGGNRLRSLVLAIVELRFPHWLASSHLQQSRTSVRECDKLPHLFHTQTSYIIR